MFSVENETPIIRHAPVPHRGVAVLVLGVVGLFTLPFILGPIAWAMGSKDLRQMSLRRMDAAGRGMTQAGRICGIVATLLSILILFFVIHQLLSIWRVLVM